MKKGSQLPQKKQGADQKSPSGGASSDGGGLGPLLLRGVIKIRPKRKRISRKSQSLEVGDEPKRDAKRSQEEVSDSSVSEQSVDSERPGLGPLLLRGVIKIRPKRKRIARESQSLKVYDESKRDAKRSQEEVSDSSVSEQSVDLERSRFGLFRLRGVIRVGGKRKRVADKSVSLKVCDEPEDKLEEESHEIVKLEAETHRSDARSHEYHVADLLQEDEEIKDPEDDWGEFKRAPLMGWFVLLALIVGGGVAWSVYNVFRVQPEIEVSTLEKRELVEKMVRENQEIRLSLDKMEQCVRAYFKARNIDELLPHVRFPERVKPLMMEYYKKHPRRKPTFHYFEENRPIPFGTRSFVHVKVALKEGGYYHLLLEEYEDQTYRVDWENDVFYQPIPWDEYVEKRPVKSMDMRVRVAPDHHYSFAFRDQERYQCYRLTAPGSDKYLFGYVERGSELAKELEEHMLDRMHSPSPDDEEVDRDGDGDGDGDAEESKQKAKKEVNPLDVHHRLKIDDEKEIKVQGRSMILRLRFLLEDDSINCVKIESMLSDQWAYYTLPNQSEESK